MSGYRSCPQPEAGDSLEELRRALSRAHERATAAERQVELYKAALRRSYQMAITPRRPEQEP